MTLIVYYNIKRSFVTYSIKHISELTFFVTMEETCLGVDDVFLEFNQHLQAEQEVKEVNSVPLSNLHRANSVLLTESNTHFKISPLPNQLRCLFTNEITVF